MSFRVLLLGTGGIRRPRHCSVLAAVTNAPPIVWKRRTVPFVDLASSRSIRGGNDVRQVSARNKKWLWAKREFGSKEKAESEINNTNHTTAERDARNQIEGADEIEGKKSSSSDVEKKHVVASSYVSTWININKWITVNLRKQAAGVLAALGLVSSTSTALFADKMALSDRLKPAIALQTFLKSEGIDLELTPTLNRRLLTNMMLLQRVQAAILSEEDSDRKDTKDGHSSPRRSSALFRREKSIPSWEEARR